MGADFEPQRVVDTLRELRSLTSTEKGAQRLCWTDTWTRAREFLRSHLDEIADEVDTDEAGNLWARIEGQRPETVVFGSHIDSVPDGGWLDGAFGVMAALEMLRHLQSRTPLACSVAFVDWADEEGARFGRSLFGSSAVSGTLDVAIARTLQDRDGNSLENVVRDYGVDLDQIHKAQSRLATLAAYVEAHIEQGPVLEQEGVGAGAVLGTFGIERHRVVFRGEAAHAGSTPMHRRRDPLLAASTTALAVREAAVRHGGVGTVGAAAVEPGVVTAIGERVEILVDQRHLDGEALDAMNKEVREASRRAADAERCEVEWNELWRIEPVLFDQRLIDAVAASCLRVVGRDLRLPSGALHDAAEMARHAPTVMVFAESRRGLSHNRAEDTSEDSLRQAATVFRDAVNAAIDLVVERTDSGSKV